MTQQQAANEVLACLQAMVKNNTNPVLDVIEPDKPFIENRKYPENKLTFNSSEWRAYYHSHGDPYRFENEHGHFHIFHKFNDTQWTHVAGLSMDNQGQAQKWFTTNRWVTNEHLQPAAAIIQYLDQTCSNDGLLLVERWLMAMLQLYQDDLSELLEARDRALQKLTHDMLLADVLDNHDYYLLSEVEINLQSKLAGILVKDSIADLGQTIS